MASWELRSIIGFEFEEGDIKNIVYPEVGWKDEPEGDTIDTLHDTEWSQLLVIKFCTWMSSRDVSS